MVYAPHPRPLGLPNSPRPNKTVKPAAYSPSPDLLPNYPAPSKPLEALAPSLHVRSRSQPPYGSSFLPHARSPSATDIFTDDTHNNLIPRGQGWTQRSHSSSSSPGIAIAQPENRVVNALSIPDDRAETSAGQAKWNELHGDGNTIWSAVSTVASILTVSTSKAWSSSIPTFAGEETPPGQDSRLTQAMKAYHIAKARDPSDLPEWLFDERERRIATGQLQTTDAVSGQAQAPQSYAGFETASVQGWATPPPPCEPVPGQPPLRGTDRLKAMRNARRARELDTATIPITNDYQPSHQRIPHISPAKEPRVGLPSGPQRGRR